MAHRVMRRFRMDEISGVDRPAQKGARMAIMKRDTPDDHGSIAIAVGRDAPDALPAFFALAKDIDGVLQKADGALDEPVAALAGAIVEALKSAESERAPLLHKIFDAFRSRNQLLLAGENGAVMNKDLAKALGLAENATQADYDAAVTKMAADTKATADKVKKLEADLAIAKMTPEEKAYCDKLREEDKASFAGLTPEEKAAKMKAEKVEKSADEIRFEKVERENADLKKRLEKAEDERALDATIAKCGTELKFIGKPSDLGAMLHSATKADPKLGEAIETTLKGLNERMRSSKLFEEIGKSTGSGSGVPASEQIKSKALAKREADPKLSAAKARDLVRRENPELEKQEREEENARAA